VSAFDEVDFPDDIAYGSSGGPTFSTGVIVVDSGGDERTARWQTPKKVYDAAYTQRTLSQIRTLLAFVIARKGAARGFRFKDFNDFTTAADHVGTPSDTDVEIGIGDGSTRTFQLVKKYGSGSAITSWTITKPVTGTTVVSIDDVAQTSGWSVNLTVGWVVFTVAPAIGEVIKAGCEFRVPCWFAKSIDKELRAAIEEYDTGSITSIPIEQGQIENEVDDDYPYRGSLEINPFSASYSLTLTDGFVISLTPDTIGLDVILPAVAGVPLGGPHFMIHNNDVTKSFNIVDETDTIVATVAAGEKKLIFLSNVGASRVWISLAS